MSFDETDCQYWQFTNIPLSGVFTGDIAARFLNLGEVFGHVPDVMVMGQRGIAANKMPEVYLDYVRLFPMPTFPFPVMKREVSSGVLWIAAPEFIVAHDRHVYGCETDQTPKFRRDAVTNFGKYNHDEEARILELLNKTNYPHLRD